nr:hypothetical protein [uncultured Ottowia sp.]
MAPTEMGLSRIATPTNARDCAFAGWALQQQTAAPCFSKPGSDAVFAVAAVSGIPSHIPSSPQALAQRVRTRVAASPHFLQFGPWKEKERAVRGAALSQFALQVCAFDKGLGKFHFLDKFTVDMYYKQS